MTTSASASTARASRRERWAWYMYDFGNSAYAAVVLLAVYSAYFKQSVVGGAVGSWYWGLALGIAMIVVALTSPFLGTIADVTRSKKKFLLIYTSLSCLFTAALYFVTSGRIVLGMILFILAEIGYRSAQVFYNALLPEIAAPDEIGRVSGKGWAIGSAGGIVCLLIVLVLMQLFPGATMTRLSFPLTAVFFAAAAAPIFLVVRRHTGTAKLPEGETYITYPIRRLGRTIRQVRSFKDFGKFLLAFLIYNDAIISIMNFAAILGGVLFGLEQIGLILFMIIVQAASIPGAYVMGRLVDRASAKRAILASLVLLFATVIVLFFTHSTLVFFILGAVAGFALTGMQSASRSFVSMLSPAKQTAEFYGLFAVTGRTSSFIGPWLFGWIAAKATVWIQNSGQPLVAAEQMAHRYALFVPIGFLLLGGLLLLWVNEKRGRATALSMNREADSTG